MSLFLYDITLVFNVHNKNMFLNTWHVLYIYAEVGSTAQQLLLLKHYKMEILTCSDSIFIYLPVHRF